MTVESVQQEGGPRFISLFSGIEAASSAWLPLGWECAAVAEVDKFCCQLLAKKYPDVPNLGDVTAITEAQIQELGPVDVVIFGSPCQDLSVAGKRAGLAGERSGLFFDAMRIVRWSGARYALWENVPGAFSSNAGADFAAVVGEMAGICVDVPNGGWRNTGVLLGPAGLVEWAVLDAQWFGVPQRRRRIFALRDSGDWANRPPILFDAESLSGNSPPRQKTGQRVAPTTEGRAGRSGANNFATSGGLVCDADRRSFGFEVGPGGGRLTETACTMDARAKDGAIRNQVGMLAMTEVIPILEAGARTGTSTDDVRAGAGIGDPGDPMYTLQSGKQHAVAIHENQRGELSLNETSGALNSGGGKPGQGYSAVLVANTLNGNSGRRQIEETLIPTTLRGHSDYGDGFPSLRAKGGDCAGGSEVLVTVGFQSKASANQSMNPSEVMPSMDVGKSDGLAIAFETRFVRNGRGAPDTIVPPLKAQSGETGKGDAAPCVATNSAVRRLLPIECERLQGFPDRHTDIGRADGPRYKALGNSMAVPVIAWIGRQILAHIRPLSCAKTDE